MPAALCRSPACVSSETISSVRDTGWYVPHAVLVLPEEIPQTTPKKTAPHGTSNDSSPDCWQGSRGRHGRLKPITEDELALRKSTEAHIRPEP